jgi:hypothetical protein
LAPDVIPNARQYVCINISAYAISGAALQTRSLLTHRLDKGDLGTLKG